MLLCRTPCWMLPCRTPCYMLLCRTVAALSHTMLDAALSHNNVAIYRTLGSEMGTPLGGIPMLLNPTAADSLAITITLSPEPQVNTQIVSDPYMSNCSEPYKSGPYMSDPYMSDPYISNCSDVKLLGSLHIGSLQVGSLHVRLLGSRHTPTRSAKEPV